MMLNFNVYILIDKEIATEKLLSGKEKIQQSFSLVTLFSIFMHYI